MVACDPYTLGQVYHGFTSGGIVTGVDYGHGLVTGYGAHGNIAGGYHAYGHHYGKREAEPWTYAQVYNGLGYPAYGVKSAPCVNAANLPVPCNHYGKRDADAYTLGQVAAGLPQYNAYVTGHPHNVGVITHVSHSGYGYNPWY